MSPPRRDGAVLDAGRHDKQVSGVKLHGVTIVEVDPELSVPAQEQLVFSVTVPGELALEPGDANDRVVDDGKVDGLPRPGQGGGGCRHGNFGCGTRHVTMLTRWYRDRFHHYTGV
jgi:hypothetical protein